ncbi:hypothetical protein ACIQ6R_28935 [Streptomyces sp. NPDC096048]|uniref:hypothetical protein n=1 Tax=Streptomyces sp. NPDC096048 TaxID=3366072 RepID=UPI00381497CB
MRCRDRGSAVCHDQTLVAHGAVRRGRLLGQSDEATARTVRCTACTTCTTHVAARAA